jgi:hypothetical protein
MKQTINTIYGEADFVFTLNDKELDNGHYNYSDGYAVIHYEDKHDVYKIRKVV